VRWKNWKKSIRKGSERLSREEKDNSKTR